MTTPHAHTPRPPTRTRACTRARSAPRRAFTLLETALAMVIVTVGVVAIIEAHQGFIRVNRWSSHESTATYLANELRERMRSLRRHDPVNGLSGGGGAGVVGWGRENGEVTVLDFDDIDDYDGIRFGNLAGVPGVAFDGPIDGSGRVIPETDDDGNPIPLPGGGVRAMPNWAQTITVTKVDPFDVAVGVDRGAIVQANGVARPVDQWPLRVSVAVWYQDPLDNEAELVTTVSWIVTPDR